MRQNIKTFYFVLLFSLATSSYSQGIRIIETTGRGFPEESAYMDAREKALKQAGLKVISVFSEIQSGNNVQVSTARQVFISAVAKGIIIEEDTLQPASLLPGNQTENKPLYETKLSIKIKNVEEDDPYFRLAMNFDPKRSSFRDGEAVSLKVNATKECYLTVFSIGADNKLYLVFPNTIQTNNHIKIQDTIRIGNLIMGLLPGFSNSAESIVGIATKENFPFINFEDKSKWKNQRMGDGQYIEFRFIDAATKLGEWLGALNEDQWTLERLPYVITK
jgi:Domain of unknown function (DUF4384)